MADEYGAVGIFDSGVGGLTVLARVAELLPHESIVYLGDTARVPYGTKSGETVVRYARACAELLVERGIKLLVVACNTASAHALEILRQELGIPVLGVIDPGARCAVEQTRSRRIGVIGTASTIASGAYESAILAIEPQARIFPKSCPFFVPLAEEGWLDGPVPRQVAQTYLSELLDQDVDTLVLGCTHYPLLKSVIADTMGPRVALVDSAEATSRTVAETLRAMGLEHPGGESVECRFLVTDDPVTFGRVGKLFLGRDIGRVEWVDFR